MGERESIRPRALCPIAHGETDHDRFRHDFTPPPELRGHRRATYAAECVGRHDPHRPMAAPHRLAPELRRRRRGRPGLCRRGVSRFPHAVPALARVQRPRRRRLQDPVARRAQARPGIRRIAASGLGAVFPGRSGRSMPAMPPSCSAQASIATSTRWFAGRRTASLSAAPGSPCSWRGWRACPC